MVLGGPIVMDSACIISCGWFMAMDRDKAMLRDNVVLLLSTTALPSGNLVIHNYEPLLTTINHQSLWTTMSNYSPLPTNINHYQPSLLTTMNHDKPFSTITTNHCEQKQYKPMTIHDRPWQRPTHAVIPSCHSDDKKPRTPLGCTTAYGRRWLQQWLHVMKSDVSCVCVIPRKLSSQSNKCNKKEKYNGCKYDNRYVICMLYTKYY